jgi:hypothetical protein
VNIWVQKSRLVLKRNRKGWHCSAYLDGKDGDPNERYPSGGRNSTKSPQSMAYIRQIQPDDMVLLYQVDDDSIHAISQSDSYGVEADPGSREFNLFYLKPAATAFRLNPPLTLTKLRETGCRPACFEPGTNGRIFSLSIDEFVGIAKAITLANPDQAKEFSAWMRERS